jgi:hypothetical protein
VNLMRAREDLIVGFLFLILLLQGYIIFVRTPSALVSEGQKEDAILLQGKDPSEPSPLPGQQPQIIKSGPVPVVSFGEGQPTPTVSQGTSSTRGTLPQSASSQGVSPGVVTQMQGNLSLNPGLNPQGSMGPGAMPAGMSNQGSVIQEAPPEDAYRKFLISLVLLEESGKRELRLTRQQAIKILAFIRKGEGQKEAVPSAQKGIQEVLAPGQLRYISRLREQMVAKNLASPDKLDTYAAQVVKMLKAQ